MPGRGVLGEQRAQGRVKAELAWFGIATTRATQESTVERLFPITCSFPCQLTGLVLQDGFCFPGPSSLSSQMANQKQYHHSLQHPTIWLEGLSPPPSQPSLAQRLTGTPGFLPLDQRPKTLGPCQGRRTAKMLTFLWSGSNRLPERLFSFPGTPGDEIVNPLCQDKKVAIKERREGWARGTVAVLGCPLLPTQLCMASTLCNHPCLGLGS